MEGLCRQDARNGILITFLKKGKALWPARVS